MRNFRYLLLVAGASCLCSAPALAQTKFSWTDTCGKADPQHMLPAGDRPDHSFGVEQLKCTATKPLEIGTDKAKEAVATDITDATGTRARFHGVYVLTMQSGDKAFAPYQGTATTSKDGKPIESHGTFTFSGGSGKLKGLKGKGTFTCKAAGEGYTCDAEGEYQLGK
jgi:hypothetical protein